MSDIKISRPSVTVTLSGNGSPPAVSLGAPAAQVAIQRTGVPGPPGLGLDIAFEAVADVAAPMGLPLATSRGNGHLIRADAANKPAATVAGLANAPTSIGFAATAVRGTLTLTDWSAIAGTATLAVGQIYFLAAGGGLTTIPPASPNCLVIVGSAASPTTLLVDPQPPIQL